MEFFAFSAKKSGCVNLPGYVAGWDMRGQTLAILGSGIVLPYRARVVKLSLKDATIALALFESPNALPARRDNPSDCR